MRVTGIGSQYLFAALDAGKNFFDGAKTYKVTLPKGIPAEKLWSLTLYDNQALSMLDTTRQYPRAGRQIYPSTGCRTERRRFQSSKLDIFIAEQQKAQIRSQQLAPSINLLEKCKGRWRLWISPAVMTHCHWVKTVLVRPDRVYPSDIEMDLYREEASKGR